MAHTEKCRGCMYENACDFIDCRISKKQSVTTLIDGITECCGYDFGADGIGKTKVRFCPLCGKRIVNVIE